MSRSKVLLLVAILPVFNASFISCSKDNDSSNPQYDQITPTKAKPAWGPTLTKQMQTVIEALDTIAPIPIQNLTPAQARVQPGAADAAMRVMNNYKIQLPAPNVDTAGRDIPVNGGSIHVRLYTPKTGKASYPLIVYYHGGGWVIATIDTYNSSAQALAEQTDAIVMSVEYRKGPEFRFPTAHMDAFEAYKWAIKNASLFKADTTKVGIAGESAGGNLAVAVSIMARDSGIHMPSHIVSVYPVATADLNTPSKIQYADAKPLSKPALIWFLGYYLNNTSEANDTRISLVNANLKGLPSTTIINAEIDPLASDGEQLAAKLSAAGVTVNRQVYTGVTHEFFGMAAVIPEAKTAQAYAVQHLKSAFGN